MATEGKHTPGPWRESHGDYDRQRGYTHGTIRANGIIIAGLPAPGSIGAAEMDANARLIAAAPETAAERDRLREVNATLLTTLDDLCGPGAQFEATCDESEHDQDSACVWCEARAAIAKAEGRM
jgi:hypothetical protein